jgi:hypothetical protein
MSLTFNELEQQFKMFAPQMQELIRTAVGNAVSFINDHTDGMSPDEMMTAVNLGAVFDQSIAQLALLLDPDYRSDDIVTFNMRVALKYVTITTVALSQD